MILGMYRDYVLEGKERTRERKMGCDQDESFEEVHVLGVN